MPLPRFQRLDPERRRAILDAAAAEFAAHGFRDASYNQIIAQAGVSKGAMYYYFDDKADLFLTVVAEAFTGLGAMAQVPQGMADPEAFWEALGQMAAAMWAFMSGDPTRLALGRALATAIDSGDMSMESMEFMADLEEVTRGLVLQGQGIGALRTDLPAELLVRLFTAVGQATDGWLAAHLDEMSAEDAEGFMGKITDLFRRVGRPEGL